MEKKKKGVMQSIPGWAWVLISLAAAILLWYALSINPKTARSFPFIPAILEAAKRMIDNGALGQDDFNPGRICTRLYNRSTDCISYGMVPAGQRSSGTMDSVYS